MDDTRARFLTAIAGRLGADRIVELHLFSPIRQGVVETGVAVVAVTPGGDEAEAEWGAGEQAQWGAGEAELAESPISQHPTVPPDPTIPEHPTVPVPLDPTVPVPEHPTVPVPADRLVVFTARYHLTRKGSDRGKWLFECEATADAPLATVDAVARGVTQRSKDLTETERFSGDQLRTLLQDPAWRMPA
jgi:hypothetical protein